MTTNSKPLFYLIISITLLLFIISIIWKFSKVDNSEKIIIPLEQKVISSNLNKINPIKHSIPKNITKPEVMEPHEIKKAYEDEVTFNMKLVRYRTVDQFLDAIDKYQSKGEFEKVDKVTERLIQLFPEYKSN